MDNFRTDLTRSAVFLISIIQLKDDSSLSPSIYYPPQSTYLFQRHSPFVKQFWKALFEISRNVCNEFVFFFFNINGVKQRPCSTDLNFGNKKRSHGAKSGEWGGWGANNDLIFGITYWHIWYKKNCYKEP